MASGTMTNAEISLQTRVERFALKRPLRCGCAAVFLGSCFADSMGLRFSDHALPALSNPLGTLYNPASIRAAVEAALAPSPSGLPLFQTGDAWRCWLAGTQIEAASADACRQLVGERLGQLREALGSASHLFVTLGTNVCYTLRESGLTVANCHKAPQQLFEERSLSVTECAEALSQMVEAVCGLNPDIEVVFTVSPYRYRKYGFHGSQLAKSTLLLAIDEVCRRLSERCSYLPVYELFMDQLRDYRFYEADMIHPSPLAVDIVWQRLVEECMEPRLQQFLVEYEPLRRALQHRPQAPESAEYKDFIGHIRQQRDALLARYSQL